MIEKSMEKGVFIKDIQPNTNFSGIFVFKDAIRLESSRGPYWKLILADASGHADARMWHPLSEQYPLLNIGISLINGKAVLYNNQFQLIIEKFQPLNEEIQDQLDKRDLMQSSIYDLDEMFDELLHICREEFVYPQWRKLIFSLIKNPQLAKAIKNFPAAKNVHHAYVGGLLEHTLGVVRLCRQFCDNYPQLDRQTLLAGALFHDLGKIKEFSGGLTNDYTDEGRLKGHMVLGLEILMPYLDKSELQKELKDHLIHLILSHHGELEFGAVKMPQTAEAMALHFADNLDAKLAQCRNIVKDLAPEERWSAWQNTLGRQILRSPLTPNDPKIGKTGRQEECLSLLKE